LFCKWIVESCSTVHNDRQHRPRPKCFGPGPTQ
jgi:hypothetical protein